MAIFKVTAKPDFTELKNAISGLESTPIKIDIDTTPVIAKIKTTSQNLSKMTQTFDGSGQMTGVVQQYNSKLGETVQVTRRLNKETGELEVTQEKVTQNYEKVAKAAERAAQMQAKAQAAAQKAQDAEASKAAAEAQKIQNVLGSMGTNIGTFSGNAAEAKEWIASLDGMSGATVKATGNVRNAAGVFQTYSAAVDGAKGTTDNFTFAINESTGEVYKLSNGAVDAAKKSSLLGDSLGRVLLKMAAWQVFGDMISKVMGSFREAINTLKDVDTEMVNVQKVTDYSNTQMKELEENAYSLASAYGRTADEITAMYTTFARAGYLGDQLDSMTELGTLLANIGDISQDTAAKFLLAVDAAWKLNGSESELMTVMDGLNEITNKNAVDMEALTSGITVAGSVFAEAGESVQTFSALVGAGVAATQRSGSEISRGLRTIIMNIRQIKGELEDGELVDGESIAKASETLKKYAGISTMANGQLRESSAVLSDLAGKWDTLDTVAQSAIAEALAGKRQANILTALMGSWDTVEKMMQDYADGAGSALKENEIYLDSWEAKSKQLTASWTEFVSHLVETDNIKDALDGVIGLVELLDSEGGHLVVTVGLLTGAVLLLGQAKKALAASEAIKDIKAASSAIKTLTQEVIAYAVAKKAAAAGDGEMALQAAELKQTLAASLGKLKGFGIGAAIFAALALAIHLSTEKARAYEKALEDVEAAQSALDETKSEYDELINKTGELTDAEQKRLEVLKELRQEQEKQLEAAQKSAWEAWDAAHGSGASVVVGGAEGVGGGLGVGAVKTERMDIVALRNYREELAEIAAQYQDGETSAGAYYSALEDLNAAREESVETIRAAILAGYEVTDEQRELVDAYDRVQQILGITSDATAEYVSGLVEEAAQSGKTEKELYDLVAAQITASNTKLNFSQQIMALQQLAVQAGYAGNALANTFALAGINESNVKRTAEGLLYTGQYSSYEAAYAEALRRAQSSMLYQFGKLTSTAPSGGWGGSSGGGTYKSDYTDDSVSKKKEQEAEKLANARKKAAQATIDAIKKQRDAETDAIDEQIEALKKQNEETERGEKLEELKLNILKRQDELLNARNERTVRQYNAATGQWEWVADAQKVKDAEDALEDAKKDLRDYERDTERELAIEELEARKKAIEAAYQLKIDTWQKLIDELNGDVETEAALLAASRGDWETYYREMLKVYQKLLDAAQDYEDKKQEIQNSGNTGGDTTGGNEDSGGGDGDDSSKGNDTGDDNKSSPTSEVDRLTPAQRIIYDMWMRRGVGTYEALRQAKENASDKVKDNFDKTAESSKNYENTTVGKLDGLTKKDTGSSGSTSGSGVKKPSSGGNTLGGGKNINKVSQYDSGGVLHGLGGIKATVDDEMVLPPDVTRKLLTPSAENRAMEVISGMRLALNDRMPYGQSLAGVTNNSSDSHDVSYYVNGVPIGADMAKLPMEQIVRQLNMAAFQGQVFNGW